MPGRMHFPNIVCALALLLASQEGAVGVNQREFDCTARQLAFDVATRRLATQLNVSSALKDVHDALRLSLDCGKGFAFDAPASTMKPLPIPANAAVFHADPSCFAFALNASRKSTSPQTVIILKPGWYFLNETLQLSSRDSGTSFRAETPGTVVFSGGVDFDIHTTTSDDSIIEADIPEKVNMARVLEFHVNFPLASSEE